MAYVGLMLVHSLRRWCKNIRPAPFPLYILRENVNNLLF